MVQGSEGTMLGIALPGENKPQLNSLPSKQYGHPAAAAVMGQSRVRFSGVFKGEKWSQMNHLWVLLAL